MNSTSFIEGVASKGRKLATLADSLFHDDRTGLWVRAGLAISAATLSLYALNRALTVRALNHKTKASFDWSKEIVVVTGGSGGIGGETVKRLAAGGTTVVVLDLIPLTFKKMRNVHYYKCNLMDYEQLQSVAEKIRTEVGEPTVIVANAGIYRGKPILDAEKKDIELTFGVNSLGVLWTAKTFLPALASRNHGHFLVVASQTGYLTVAGTTDYSASKAAAVSIYEGLHSEMKHVYKAPAVRVSCICPTHVQTAMFHGMKDVPGMASITPQSLAETIEGILKSGRAHNLVVPSAVWITLLRALPSWVRVLAQDVGAGAFSDMKPRDTIAQLATSGDQK